MARKSPTILQEELYPPSAERLRDDSPREEWDDARLIDLDTDEESPFLRAQKRVSARRGALPRRTANYLVWAMSVAGFLCVGVAASAALYRYGEHSWRFRVESSDNLEIAGTQNVTKAQIMEVMGADIGRNIFFIPLAQQKAQLEQIPWIESASIMRFVPNRLHVEIHERTPVAFARVGARIALIDAGGTLMELPRNHKYSFPVILGMNPGEPLSTRAPRMKAYGELIRDLDSGGARYSEDLSEVDLSDLDDVKVRVNDPAGDVVLHLGSSNYLKRYKTYISHAQEWRQQFQKLESVNLRYDNQVIVNPDMESPPKKAALSAANARAAEAAGVKPAALVTRIPHDRPIPKPAFELSPRKVDSKAVTAKKPAAKTKVKKTTAKLKIPLVAQKSGRKSGAHKTPALKSAKPTSAPTANAPPARQQTETRKLAQSVPPHEENGKNSKPSPAITKQQASTNAN